MAGDVAQAQEALQRWRAASRAGAKLAAALQEGASLAVLSRAIQVRSRTGWQLWPAHGCHENVVKLSTRLAYACSHAAVSDVPSSASACVIMHDI